MCSIKGTQSNNLCLIYNFEFKKKKKKKLTVSNEAASLFLKVSPPFASTLEVLCVGVHAMPSVNFFVISTKSSASTYFEPAVEGRKGS